MEKKETYNEEQKAQIQIKELGSRLKSIREAQGLSIADVFNVTKIQKHYLAAIEEGDLDHLPKGPYVRSFIRQYCDHLSAPDLWKSYDAITKRQKAAEPPIPQGDETNYSDSPKIFKPRSFLWLYLLIVLSLGAAGWITWQYRGDIKTSATSPIDGGTTGTVREQQPEEQQAPLSADEAVRPLSSDAVSKDEHTDLSWMDGKQPQPATAAAKAPDNQEAPNQAAVPRSLKVTAENAYVWMKISRGDKILFEGTMKPGEIKEYEVSSGLPIRVRIGKPGSTSVLWEGKKIFPVAPGSNPATKFFWPDGKITDS
ncbi:MAG: helix-turn-helix domain-containing protein [Synergistaceae bacterium]